MSEYKLSDKQKMLGMALYARRVGREEIATILMVLEDDGQVDDMTWFMTRNPQSDAAELMAVAYQIAKDAHNN